MNGEQDMPFNQKVALIILTLVIGFVWWTGAENLTRNQLVVTVAAAFATIGWLAASMSIHQTGERIDNLRDQLYHAFQSKDNAYRERNYVVAALARVFPSGIRPTKIEGWDPEWENCVYIDLPTGQISYHYHLDDSDLFIRLPDYLHPFDHHDKKTVHQRLFRLNSRIDNSDDGYVSRAFIESWFDERIRLCTFCLDVRAEETERWVDFKKLVLEGIDEHRQGIKRVPLHPSELTPVVRTPAVIQDVVQPA